MPVEGEITIKVKARFSQIEFVEIASSRPLHIAQLFIGKSINTVENIINMLYQLCNIAHRFAFLKLLNENKTIQLSQNEMSAYHLLLALETIKEHCFSIASKWNISKYTSIDVGIISLLTTIKEISNTLFTGGDPLSLANKQLQPFESVEKLIFKLEKQLQSLLLGEQVDSNLVFSHLKHFDSWLQTAESKAAIFLNNLQSLNKIGDVKALHLPDLNLKELGVLLQNDAYIKQPNYQNTLYETTPYSRQSTHSFIEEMTEVNGRGVFTRASAQLFEVFELLHRVKNDYQHIVFENISYTPQFFEIETTALTQLEAARGRLVHQMSIRNKTIISYQILAPTEWNFHPNGVLKQMIFSLNFTDKEDLIAKVKLLVNAIDPCVGYSVEVDYA
ncbi:hypothetical protein MS2017_2020 [Bathymodiolus thermophilus thioautotrophic gill symbiont]|uniref:Ni,Fe-hydrogenase I large subunit n=1 Tax=Bathymodiolus thermophilus thioautotrophic gill symbiont TaxID=2360 RepID=A0A3G3IPL7_9GAMM|nr:nickel-dependent hydrogenase large subunit [Bathymodiolus thermophilus thioautotrophic gill symbiont]AYQ57678.1 hypothetical protein MS2017_2020 [Bathymodiolus thermophilus thioautotrophic gill symbiont]